MKHLLAAITALVVLGIASQALAHQITIDNTTGWESAGSAKWRIEAEGTFRNTFASFPITLDLATGDHTFFPYWTHGGQGGQILFTVLADGTIDPSSIGGPSAAAASVVGGNTLLITPIGVEWSVDGNQRFALTGYGQISDWSTSHTAYILPTGATGAPYALDEYYNDDPTWAWLRFKVADDGTLYDIDVLEPSVTSVVEDNGWVRISGHSPRMVTEGHDPYVTLNIQTGKTLDWRMDDLQSQVDDIELTPGPQGPQGKAGAAGAAGAAGTNGSDGSQGVQGKAGADGAAAPCVDCQTISDATFDLACALLSTTPPSSIADFQASVDAIAAVTTVGSGDNFCDPIPGGFSTCTEYINDQVQAIFDSKVTP